MLLSALEAAVEGWRVAVDATPLLMGYPGTSSAAMSSHPSETFSTGSKVQRASWAQEIHGPTLESCVCWKRVLCVEQLKEERWIHHSLSRACLRHRFRHTAASCASDMFVVVGRGIPCVAWS